MPTYEFEYFLYVFLIKHLYQFGVFTIFDLKLNDTRYDEIMLLFQPL